VDRLRLEQRGLAVRPRQVIAVWPFSTRRIRTLEWLSGARCSAFPLHWTQASAFCGRRYQPVLQWLAKVLQRPYRVIGDGFVAAMHSGSAWPFSIVIDDVGIYYDASRPSGLEQMIAQHAKLQLGTTQEAMALLRRVVSGRITKYNDAPLELPPDLAPVKNRRRVLVVDQAIDSPSVVMGLAGKRSFVQMLAAAVSENPGAEIWLKSPYSANETRTPGYLTAVDLPESVCRITADVNPFVLLEHVDSVYTVSSQLGFEALLTGVPVRVFGMPFYAGWGLTIDAQANVRRTARPSLAAVFDAAYLRYARYLNPVTHERGSLSDVIDCIELQRSVKKRLSDIGPLVGVGFSLWKRRFARPFLEAGGQVARWCDPDRTGETKTAIALWGAAPRPPALPPASRIVRMEDGFIHSSGLGSDLSAPHSQVIDRQGLYFDPRSPNDLTDLVNHYPFSEDLLERAEALRILFCQNGITKYNLGRSAPTWKAPVGRCLILVPGQVADDASVRYGSPNVRTVDELLQVVRSARPDAYIVYKPHPDVLSGNRKGLVEASQLCDKVDTCSDILSLIEISNEVHTLSSLAGFDALLRNKRVCTYGMPFYAGWGLTDDAAGAIPWRSRKVSLRELVAAALILYPLYWDWELGIFSTPEAVVKQLSGPAARAQQQVRGQWLRPLVKAARWLRNVAMYR
jgi:capsular polysaccharide export protein